MKMKSKYLFSILALAVVATSLSVSIVPALAKPYEVTVIVKSWSNGKPISGVYVALVSLSLDGPSLSGYQTDAHGKVKIPLNNDWTAGGEVEVFVYGSLGDYPNNPFIVSDPFYLSRQVGARVIVPYNL